MSRSNVPKGFMLTLSPPNGCLGDLEAVYKKLRKYCTLSYVVKEYGKKEDKHPHIHALMRHLPYYKNTSQIAKKLDWKYQINVTAIQSKTLWIQYHGYLCKERGRELMYHSYSKTDLQRIESEGIQLYHNYGRYIKEIRFNSKGTALAVVIAQWILDTPGSTLEDFCIIFRKHLDIHDLDRMESMVMRILDRYKRMEKHKNKYGKNLLDYGIVTYATTTKETSSTEEDVSQMEEGSQGSSSDNED